jgi:hypothetical protein
LLGIRSTTFNLPALCQVAVILLSRMDLLDPEISGDAVIRLIPSLLTDGDDRLTAATSILQRLQANLDSKAVSRSVLRLLCAHCNGEDFLVDLFLEFLQTYEEPLHVIELMSIAAADASEAKLEGILDTYKSLIVENRQLLVPVIGSISELSLSKRQRASFLSLVKGALSVVDESDIPTVVHALIYIIDHSNARGSMKAIRKEAARIPLSISMLLLDALASAIRCRTECAKAYWSDLKAGVDCNSLDILVIAALLESLSTKRTASREFILLAERNPSIIDTICDTVSLPQAVQSVFNIFRLVLQTAIALNLPGVPTPSRSAYETLIAWLQPLSISIFRHSEPLRQPLLNALLAACSVCTKGSERGSSSAAAAISCLASSQGEDMRSVAHLVFQFLAQHASSCAEATLRHLGAAAVVLARGERGVELLVLIQKQLGQLRPGTQRPGLVLAAQLLAAPSTSAGRPTFAGDGADAVLRSVLRLPLATQWRYTPLVCAALVAALPALPRDQAAKILSDRLRPAALEAGLIRLAGGEEKRGCDAASVLTVREFVRRCLAATGDPARADARQCPAPRDAGAGAAGGWDTGVAEQMVAAAAVTRAVIWFEWFVGDGPAGCMVHGCEARSAHADARGGRAVEGRHAGAEMEEAGGDVEASECSSEEEGGLRETSKAARAARDDAHCAEQGGEAASAWSRWLHLAATCAAAAAAGCQARGRVSETGLAKTEAAVRLRLRLARVVAGRMERAGGGCVAGFGGVCGFPVRDGAGAGNAGMEPAGAGATGPGGDGMDGLVRLCRQADCGVGWGAGDVEHCLARMPTSAETLPVMAEVGVCSACRSWRVQRLWRM